LQTRVHPERFFFVAMLITDILKPECVVVPLRSTTKQQVIYELIDYLAASGGIEDVPGLRKAVWDREMTRTTGIGHGVGIPHGKAQGIDQLQMALGVAHEPIEFGAIDGRPVTLVFLLASAIDQTGPHIQALAGISRMLTRETLREAMQKAASPQEVYALIETYEKE